MLLLIKWYNYWYAILSMFLLFISEWNKWCTLRCRITKMEWHGMKFPKDGFVILTNQQTSKLIYVFVSLSWIIVITSSWPHHIYNKPHQIPLIGFCLIDCQVFLSKLISNWIYIVIYETNIFCLKTKLILMILAVLLS